MFPSRASALVFALAALVLPLLVSGVFSQEPRAFPAGKAPEIKGPNRSATSRRLAEFADTAHELFVKCVSQFDAFVDPPREERRPATRQHIKEFWSGRSLSRLVFPATRPPDADVPLRKSPNIVLGEEDLDPARVGDGFKELLDKLSPEGRAELLEFVKREANELRRERPGLSELEKFDQESAALFFEDAFGVAAEKQAPENPATETRKVNALPDRGPRTTPPSK